MYEGRLYYFIDNCGITVIGDVISVYFHVCVADVAGTSQLFKASYVLVLVAAENRK